MTEKYTTQFKNSKGEKYGWHVLADSWNEAQKIADEREIGEKVIGRIPHDCLDCEVTTSH
jgi:hypothetical protein